MEAFDAAGKRYQLTPTGSSGGEGTIYRVAAAPDLAAKIMHPQRLTEEFRQKLRVMLAAPPMDAAYEARRHRSIIWPLSLAYSEATARNVIGFVMPWIDTGLFKEAHTYYDPSDRIRRFGGLYSWRHLLIAAYNLSSAVAAIHAQGHRVGDLRDTNILVAPNSLVSLIDCDSFEIVDPESGRVFPTTVGTGEFMPVELQGVSLGSGSADRYYSDLYALAVLIFKFLMLGAHPNQARGGAAADLPSIEAKIKAGIYAFGGRGMGGSPPDFAPDIKVLSPSIRRLAERTFVAGHAAPERRPSAQEWFDALSIEGPGLKTCKRNPNHLYGGHLRSCPWCPMAARGKDPFPATPNIGGQVAAATPNGNASVAERTVHLSSYIEMALVDGALSQQELRHIESLGASLGLHGSEIKSVIRQKEREFKRRAPDPIEQEARSEAPKRVKATPPAPRSRSIEELKALLSDYERSEPEESSRMGVRDLPRPIVLALMVAALASLAPLLAMIAVVFAITPGFAFSSEVASERRAGRGWSRIGPKMLTRAPQMVVQSIYYLIPAVVYSLVPLTVAYFGLVRLGLHPPTVLRWVVVAASSGWLLWILLVAPREPFVAAAANGVSLAHRALEKRLPSPILLPAVMVSLAALLIWFGLRMPAFWWPFDGPPFIPTSQS